MAKDCRCSGTSISAVEKVNPRSNRGGAQCAWAKRTDTSFSRRSVLLFMGQWRAEAIILAGSNPNTHEATKA